MYRAPDGPAGVSASTRAVETVQYVARWTCATQKILSYAAVTSRCAKCALTVTFLFLIERLLKVLLKVSKYPPEKSGIQIEKQFENQFEEQFNAQFSALKLTQVIIGQLSIPEKLIISGT